MFSICFMSRWKPSLRMTPEDAMHHSWMQDPWLHKAKQKPKPTMKSGDAEKKKENAHKSAQPEKGGLLVLGSFFPPK